MTYQDIHARVLRYLKRPNAEVGSDVALAINNAVDFLQRKMKLKVMATVVPFSEQVVDGQVVVDTSFLRSIEQVYLLDHTGIPATPVTLISAGQYHDLRDLAHRNSPRTARGADITQRWTRWMERIEKPFGFTHSDQLVIKPLRSPEVNFIVRGIEWIQPDIYVTNPDGSVTMTTSENPVLRFCSEYIIYKSLIDLELFLKNDIRAQTLSGYVGFLYDSVEQWNQTFDDHSTTFLQ